MSELRLGDKVLSVRLDGSTFFDEIYMFGHKEAAVISPFVHLVTEFGTVLRLTADHHVLVEQGPGTWSAIPASQTKVGDVVGVLQGGSVLATQRIVSKSIVMGRGLFNPYTLGGSIVVDGVLASCHSSWALDGVFTWLGVPIAEGYQAAFAPIRALYRLLGPERMASLEFVIDAVADAGNRGILWSVTMRSSVIAFASLVTLRLAMKRIAF
jgi:hypothetical protein